MSANPAVRHTAARTNTSSFGNTATTRPNSARKSPSSISTLCVPFQSWRMSNRLIGITFLVPLTPQTLSIPHFLPNIGSRRLGVVDPACAGDTDQLSLFRGSNDIAALGGEGIYFSFLLVHHLVIGIYRALIMPLTVSARAGPVASTCLSAGICLRAGGLTGSDMLIHLCRNRLPHVLQRVRR